MIFTKRKCLIQFWEIEMRIIIIIKMHQKLHPINTFRCIEFCDCDWATDHDTSADNELADVISLHLYFGENSESSHGLVSRSCTAEHCCKFNSAFSINLLGPICNGMLYGT